MTTKIRLKQWLKGWNDENGYLRHELETIYKSKPVTQHVHEQFWLVQFWPKYINDPSQIVRINLGQFEFVGDPYRWTPLKKHTSTHTLT